MTLQQKILALLAQTTSRYPCHTAAIMAGMEGVPKYEVVEALEDLREALQVGHCRSIKGANTVDYWWLAGNVESKLLPQTAAANRRTKAARAAKGKK